MSIMPISNSVLTGSSPATPAFDPSTAEARLARAALQSSATPLQTEQAVSSNKKAEASQQEVADAVKQVNEFVQPINSSIEFQVDKDSGKTVVKVVDNNTKEVIRQFPSEEMLSIAKAIGQMKGLLVQQKA